MKGIDFDPVYSFPGCALPMSDFEAGRKRNQESLRL
jgi:hypothetical protein